MKLDPRALDCGIFAIAIDFIIFIYFDFDSVLNGNFAVTLDGANQYLRKKIYV